MKIADRSVQPEAFEFNAESQALAEKYVAKYPKGRQHSAVMPLLDLAQRQCGGWLPQAAIRYVADRLDMPYIRAFEVASFYTMYNLSPVGEHLVGVCTTTPCWLRGSDSVMAACRKTLGIHGGETTEDGRITLVEVECLGACVNAPMMQIGDDYFEDLDAESTTKILEALKNGEAPNAGPQVDRQTSAPEGGPTTLREDA